MTATADPTLLPEGTADANEPKLLSEITAAGDAARQPEPGCRRTYPGPKQIRQAAERSALGYLQASAAALETNDPKEPLNYDWAQRTGAFLPQAFDALYQAIPAAEYLTSGQELGHAETRGQVMQTLDRLCRQANPHNLSWTLYTDRILENYRNLPRY